MTPEKMAEEYEGGATIGDIAIWSGLSTDAVRAHLRRQRVELRASAKRSKADRRTARHTRGRSRRSYTRAEKVRMAEAAQDVPAYLVAEENGVNLNTLRDWIKQWKKGEL